jgi:predicted DNA-binding protein with PD1-like motif
MHLVEIKNSKKFIGELSRGIEITRAVTKILQDNSIRCGHIRIMGHLEKIDLLTDGSKGVLSQRRTISQPSQIVSCEGFITELNGKFEPILYTLISTDLDTGIHTIGGVLEKAVVVSCDFIVESFEDLFIRRKIDAKIKLPVWVETITNDDEVSEEPSSPISYKSSTIANIASSNDTEIEEIEEEEDEEEEEEEIIPEPGDFIDHFKLRVCEVIKYEADVEILTVLLPSKRQARLGVQYLSFSVVTVNDNGTKIYKCVTRRIN